jgi:ribosomal protein L11 methylase PrmA
MDDNAAAPRDNPPQPNIRELGAALSSVRALMDRIDRGRTADVTNTEGGDAGHHASPRLLLRHTVNYALAADLARRVKVKGPLLDVGSGVGVFSVWLASQLERKLHLVDHDPTVRQVAEQSFHDLTVHADLDNAPPSPVVTAMEVIEHIAPGDQLAFVRALNRPRSPRRYTSYFDP